jgi:protein-L-isoaspartate(D-aspartate) O-methyltransferase
MAEHRAQLVELLRRQGIRDEHVLAAIGRVRRELFLPPELADRAYENTSLPIGLGQTISQPIVVANMTEVLQLSGSERVLEIGAGSGYQAAVLAELAASVVSVERVPDLRQRASVLLFQLGYRNIVVHAAGEDIGWPADAPYDRIIVTAGGPRVPAALLDQLAVGGRLVMPVGTLAEQRLIVAVRNDCGIVEDDLGRVRFVPLIGPGGWPEGSVPQEPPAEATTA